MGKLNKELNSLQKQKIRCLVVSLAVFVSGFLLDFSGVFDFLENKSYDRRIRFSSYSGENTGIEKYLNILRKKPCRDEITVVQIDQKSISQAGKEFGWGWPWPREAYSDIIRFFDSADARSIVFDIFFTEESNFGFQDDLKFAEAMKESGRVIQAVFSSKENEPLFPVGVIKENSALLGNITSIKDSDGIIRRSRISYCSGGTEYVSLGLSPLFLENGESSDDGNGFSVLSDEDDKNEACADESDGKSENKAGFSEKLSRIKQKIPLDKDGAVLLRYKGTLRNYQPLSAFDIVKSQRQIQDGEESVYVPEDIPENSDVFVMCFAPGLYDICPTPIAQDYPGAGVHIALLDNYISGDFIRSAPFWLVLLFCAFVSLSSALLVYRIDRGSTRKRIPRLSLAIVSESFLAVLVSYSAVFFNVAFPVVLPVYCFLVSFILNVFVNYTQEGKQRRFIKSAFAQYLSPLVIERLLSNPEELKLGGEKKNIAIMFSDIQGFTSVSENLEPEKLTELLNLYLSEMSEIILDSGGTIDKYEGDAIIAFWNAPLDIKNYSRSALEAAVMCQKRLSELEKDFSRLAGRPLLARIGLNTGDAVVGNMGSRHRFDYTMFGDSVNLASRLEGINRQFGTYTICSESLKENAEKEGTGICFREISRVQVVGKNEPVVIYEPFLKEQFEEKRDVISVFEKGLSEFYKGDFRKAEEFFSMVSEKDPPSAKYKERCEKLMSLPNDKEWKGVWVSDRK